MSAIAGIVHFEGPSVELESIKKMTTAMERRGPDGSAQWADGLVGLGHCMLRTTPESLGETQPLANEDKSLLLVMDGRVDNREELRRELSWRGLPLRDDTDAELVLKAYQAWGEQCPNKIIGEFVFFAWDVRRRQLFGARDAAGTRHFYYHEGGAWFAFASEIKGLLALGRLEPRLNESRLLDCLTPEFDRDDQVGTFYKNIKRLPAGHSIKITAQGAVTWRYWDPTDLTALSFASLDECAEAFLEQLRIAVKCRLRSVGPVAAMLSGGLDSTSIVGLISNEFREHLAQPLRTFSLIRDDRENCLDWPAIRSFLQEDSWISAEILNSDLSLETCREFLAGIDDVDEPFEVTHGLTAHIIYKAASDGGCRTLFDGMAGDLLFYGFERSLDTVFRRKKYALLPAILSAAVRHGTTRASAIGQAAYHFMATEAPTFVRDIYQRARDRRALLRGGSTYAYTPAARRLLAEKYALRRQVTTTSCCSDQALHARFFTSGLLSFAHEVSGAIALSKGVEPRSPFSDRRLIELAIRMPLEAKLHAHWYKSLLRKSMGGLIPEEVRWRRTIAGHPGWKFHQKLFQNSVDVSPQICDFPKDQLEEWVSIIGHATDGSYEQSLESFRLGVSSIWLSKFDFHRAR